MEENVESSVADDVCICIVWFGQYGWIDERLILFHIPLFSETSRLREAFHADLQLRKNFKGCIVIFFSACFSWYLLYPKLFDLMLSFPSWWLFYFLISILVNFLIKQIEMQRWILVSLAIQWILWVLFNLHIITCLQEASKNAFVARMSMATICFEDASLVFWWENSCWSAYQFFYSMSALEYFF